MSTSIDYDYDEVISFCQVDAQTDVNNLTSHLNELSNELTNCEESFHTQNPTSVISDIYKGFSLIIGSTNENTGLSGLVKEIADIINVCYGEAMNDKKILEEDAQPTSTNINSAVGNSNINTSKYSGTLHGRGNTTEAAQATLGVITTDNPKYQVVPDSEYTGAKGQISQSDYNLLIAQVAGESGNSADDMLGVTSTVLNRLESDSGFGDSVSQVFEQGYFPWGKSYLNYVEGGQYYNTDWGQEKLNLATQVVNDALNGTRNVGSNVYYYSGNGEYNKFSDQV